MTTIAVEPSPNITSGRQRQEVPHQPRMHPSAADAFAGRFEDSSDRPGVALASITKVIGINGWDELQHSTADDTARANFRRFINTVRHTRWPVSRAAAISTIRLLRSLAIPDSATPQFAFDDFDRSLELLWLVSGSSLTALVNEDGGVEIWAMAKDGREIFAYEIDVNDPSSRKLAIASQYLATISVGVRAAL